MSKNRGKEGRDDQFFGTASAVQRIQEAVEDLSFLWEKDYGEKSSLELVGNRYRLSARQQKALRGMSAGISKCKAREAKRKSLDQLQGEELYIDGFNVLILLESLLSEAYIFQGKDGCYRDLSSVHGTYRKVNQTIPALEKMGTLLQKYELSKITWLLDKPVSNSGKLKKLLESIADENNYHWEVLLDFNPDKTLSECGQTVVTSDAYILDECTSWCNLVAYFIPQNYPYLIRAKS